MSINIQKIKSLQPDSKIFFQYGPTLEHCIGKGKLLGEYYGDALCEIFKIRNSKINNDISELSMLMRSYIVIDDFLKDSNLKNNYNEFYINWLSNIEQKIIFFVSLYHQSPNELWLKYLKIYKDSYLFFDKNNMFKSIINKCNFIFLPFDLNPFINFDTSKIKEIIEKYLFSLQLIDDFHDMEDDVQAPKNHNLYLAKIPNNFYKYIINCRPFFLKPLLNYIIDNLNYIDVNGYLKCPPSLRHDLCSLG